MVIYMYLGSDKRTKEIREYYHCLLSLTIFINLSYYDWLT